MERAAGRGWTVNGSLPAYAPEALVRWGGYALVAGGALGIVSEVVSLLLALGILSHLSPGYEYFHEYYRGKRLLNVLYDLPKPLAALLVAAGMCGVYSLLGGKRRRLARSGLILAVSSAVLTAVPGLYRTLTQPPPFPYGLPEAPPCILVVVVDCGRRARQTVFPPWSGSLCRDRERVRVAAPPNKDPGGARTVARAAAPSAKPESARTGLSGEGEGGVVL